MNKPVLIGVGGISRAGKDTFVKVAHKILHQYGYTSFRLAFADALKDEINPFLEQYYGISAWTDKTEEKNIIRPLLVAHGCQMRVLYPNYWIDKLDEKVRSDFLNTDVVFISDCRFPNEVDWVQNECGGWFVHLKKYSMVKQYQLPECEREEKDSYTTLIKKFDLPPNAEETYNDPICEKKANINLEMENAIEREFRLTHNKITVESLVDNTYLNEEIKLCLLKCPLLNLE